MDTESAALAEALREELVAFRRDLHAHPELSRHEVRTTDRVGARLEAAGLQPRRLALGTGLVCDIAGGAGPTVALRADLDALPIDDPKTVSYRSTIAGVSHACGHDVHTTVLLGAALVLHQLGDRLPGSVRLVFQPAEELMPGGALDVIAEGHLRGVDAILALHCDPRVPVGNVGVRTGPITSAGDRLDIRIRGAGGHTARPHLAGDVIHAAGLLASSLPAALSRLVDPHAGLTVTFGSLHAGEGYNVMPREAVMLGTVRVLDSTVWRTLPEWLPQLVRDLTAGLNVEVDVVETRGVPPVDNDAQLTGWFRDALQDELGASSVVEAPQSLGGEDFGWYLEHVPGSLVRLGVAGSGSVHDLHTPGFDVDERAITIGVRTLVVGALKVLKERSVGGSAAAPDS